MSYPPKPKNNKSLDPADSTCLSTQEVPVDLVQSPAEHSSSVIGLPALNGYYREVAVADLKPHPLNAKVYGDEALPDEQLTKSIKEGGVRTPLHVTTDHLVIAGHRRLQSARAAGLLTVPAIIVRLDEDEFAAAEYLLETNRARHKTHEQTIREFIEYERIETGRAKIRMRAGKPHPGSNLTPGQAGSGTGKARDIAARKVGFSAGTANSAKAVVEALDRLHQSGKDDEEHRLRQVLQEKSIYAAHQEALQQGWIVRVPLRRHQGPNPSLCALAPDENEVLGPARLRTMTGSANCLSE